MEDELEWWVRGLGARSIEVTQDVEEKRWPTSHARRQKTKLVAEALPPETIRLEIDGRPFFVVLRDEKVYMSYLTTSGTTCIKGVKSRGAKEAALELARLIHFGACDWPDRNVAQACNWPNVVAPPVTLVTLNKAPRSLLDSSATKNPKSRSRGSLEPDEVARTEVAVAMLPGDAVKVKAANRIHYVLLAQNLVFMRVESWNASTAYLREITDLARKKKVIDIAKQQVGHGGGVHPFRCFVG